MANRHEKRSSSVGKPKNTKKALLTLLGFLKPYVVPVVIALVATVISMCLYIYGPNKIMELTNLITESVQTMGLVPLDLDKVSEIGITLVIVYLVGAVLQYLQGFIMSTVTQKVTYSLRSSISKKINVLPLKYFDSTSFGNILSRVTNDVDTIGQTLSDSVASLVAAVSLLIGSVIMMFVTNPLMAITAIGASVIGFILMIIIMSRSQKFFLRQQNLLGEINGHIEEMYSGHVVMKVYCGEKDANQKFDEINNKLASSAFKAQFLSGMMMPIMNFIGNFGYVAVCVVGAVLVTQNQIEFGVITGFMLYVRLFTNPLSQIAQASASMQTAGAASERVFEFLEEKELDKEDIKVDHLDLNDVKGNVVFEHVNFGYEENKEIIHDFSMSAKQGQKVAIVGPTGAGKTTLVNLLMRFYEVNKGRILIDGKDIANLTRSNVHSLFCMVLQDTWIFDGTIKDNIIYAKSGIKDEDVINACKTVGLDHFIRTLPKGYDTVLDDSTSLSQGQRQLLTIARAMIQNAPLLILDEATSSVDTRTEVLIQEAMDRLMKGRTSFVIAHRLSTIKNADLILVLKDGDIIESGTHEELLKQHGFYEELYNSQFEEEQE